MQENNQIIKSIVEHNCSKCGEKMFIETQTIPAITSAVFTMNELMDAKQDCLKRIEALSIEEEKRQMAIKWINDPSTIFAPGEVDGIIESLLKPEV